MLMEVGHGQPIPNLIGETSHVEERAASTKLETRDLVDHAGPLELQSSLAIEYSLLLEELKMWSSLPNFLLIVIT
jgi:hypothetical protein